MRPEPNDRPSEPDTAHAGAVAAVLARALRIAGGDPDGGPVVVEPVVVEDVVRAVLERVPAADLTLADVDGAAEAALDVVRGLLDAVALLAPGSGSNSDGGSDDGTAEHAHAAHDGAVRVTPVATSFFGPEGGRTAVDVVVTDRPLLFSTVVATLARHGLAPCRSAHPIVSLVRDADGTVTRVGPPGSGELDVALIHVEVVDALDDGRRRALADDLDVALADATAADVDAGAMRAALDRLETALVATGAGPRGEALGWSVGEAAEAAAFCRWVLERNLLLLGACPAAAPVPSLPGDGLGVCGPAGSIAGSVGLEPVAAELVPGRPLAVRRSRRRSTVARPERLAELVVADLTGAAAGAARFLGLTTLGGRSERPSRTPWVRRTLREALARIGAPGGSHDETVLSVLFDDLPWDVLLVADADWITPVLTDLLDAHQDGHTVVAVLDEPDAGAVTVLVAVATASEPTSLRDDVTDALLSHHGGGGLEVQAELGNSGMTMLSFTVFPDAPLDPVALRAEVVEACRPWSDRLGEELARHRDVDAVGVARRWLGRLSGSYRAVTPPAVAAEDLLALDRLAAGGRADRIDVRVLPGNGDPCRWHLRVAADGPPLELSRLVPVLESCGLRVLQEQPFLLGPPDAAVMDVVVRTEPGAGTRDDLGLGRPDGDAARVADAVAACWARLVDTDDLNALVPAADLTWQQVDVLRAYARYLAQLRPGTTVATVEAALVAEPATAAALFAHVAGRFGPAAGPEPFGAPPADDVAGRDAVVATFDAVARLDHERVLRDLLALVDATVRTTAFAPWRTDGDRHRPVSVVLDGARLPGQRRAATWREIWVSGPEVEGVHLRAGPVARGGLRWSDRTDDVRTEVLQLMEAQALKNAVIVPTGAKGGFVLRHRPTDTAELPAAVRAGYTAFVEGLLAVVDDLDHGTVVHPPGVRSDGADTYLVVAADRGTASFSDLANSLAEARGLWLGDAFASGGSSGYDHKALGVTARGAWVSVTDHFERLGVDIDRDGITVVGVGDMSGDVFGNGMLRSAGIRLVAAFDHRHVFLDPDPDPERSFAERRRLFGLARSSWDDYDRTVLSAGGMVIPRTDKRARLTEACRSALGLDDGELDDDGTITLPALVRAVLAAPADLLYLGGIGTYVRGDDETDGEVGDPGNDEVRIPAGRLRVRVVGEGANLGFTPPARVDAAAAGVQLNADAVDNSAGVDSSDHEVNLKILLSLAQRAGRLDRAGRDAALAEVADDVVARVLAHVARQDRAITRAEAASRVDLESHLALLFDLEAAGRVDRTVHALPSGRVVRERRESGAGLLRPELAVLLAGAKEQLADAVAADGLADRAALRPLLEAATPAALVERFGDLLDDHPLRRAIVAARLANDVVDRMGLVWAHATARRTGAPLARVAAAYWMAATTAGAAAWWARVDATPHDGRDAVWDPVVATVDALAGEYLRRGVAAAWRWDEVERDAAAAAALRAEDPAAPVTTLAVAPAAADVAGRSGCSVTDAVGAFVVADEAFGLDRLAAAIAALPLPPSEVWAQRHRQVLLADVDRLRRAAATTVLGRSERPEVRTELVARIAAACEGDGLDALAVAVAEAWLAVEEAVGGIPRA